jgi:hypothetical protein
MAGQGEDTLPMPLARAKKPRFWRRTYMLDSSCTADIGYIQTHIGASSASEAVRFAIRKAADLIRMRSTGAEIQARYPAKGRTKAKTVVLDFPRPAQDH